MKARVVQMGKVNGSPNEQSSHSSAKRATKLHLGYLEREGVDVDGKAGALYDAHGQVDADRFNEDLPGEEHQFRLIVSPEDGRAVDLRAFVQDYMEQVQEDLGRELRWAAVDHYNTDQPHAHIVIRGVDARGAKVRLERDYVSHGLRRRAEELATERLGPRPERTRVDQLRREAELERHTSLDRELARRAVHGVFAFTSTGRQRRDPHMEAALRTRLAVLEDLGLASPAGYRRWHLHPSLRTRLQVMGRQAEGMRVMRSVVRAGRYRVIDRTEERNDGPAELSGGAVGVVRWKGLDEDGRFMAVVETTSGAAYHLPVTNRVAADIRVGQVLRIKRAVDKDERIEEVAAANGRRYDVDLLPEEYREAYRQRLGQLERLQLATPDGKSAWLLKEGFCATSALATERARELDQHIEAAATANAGRYNLTGLPQHQEACRKRLEELERQQLAVPAGKSAWLLKERFRSLVNDGKPQAYWQMLSLVTDRQPLAAQSRFAGSVWLDRISQDQTGPTGFGKELRDALAERHEYLRSVGLDPQSTKLRWELRDLQQRELERSVASTGRLPVRAHDGFRGVVHVHRGGNGQEFLVIHSKDAFAVVPASPKQASLEGQDVQLLLGAKGRIEVLPSDQYTQQHPKRQEQALAQAAAAAPDAVRYQLVGGASPGTGAASELDAAVRGIVRWVGSDAAGAHHAVIETLSGTAYYLPLTGAVAAATKAGQLVEMQRAPDTDAHLRAAALQRDCVYGLAGAAEGARPAFRRRLEELESLRLATRVGEAEWRLSDSFLRSKAPSPRPVWLRAESQALEEQRTTLAFSWLDRVRGAELSDRGFGVAVREALREREAFLRGIGIDPDSENLRWNLRDAQQRQLEQTIASSTGLKPLLPHEGFRGVAHVHRASDGQTFLVLRSDADFVIVPASRQQASLEGQDVRLHVGAKGRIELFTPEQYDLQHKQRADEALARIVEVVPNAARCEVVAAARAADGITAELDVGVRGIVRWVGSDGRGAPHAVVETPSGTAYHVPLSADLARAPSVGHLVEMQRAPNTDEHLRQGALQNGGVYDLVQAPNADRHGHQRRLEALERQRLATPVGEGQWRLSESLLRTNAPSPQRIWVRAEAMPLETQKKTPGYVWLDRVRGAELASSGFGATLREALHERDAHLRALGVDPESKDLRWKLRDLQQLQLAKTLEAAGNARLVAVHNGFAGTVHLHQATNGERFVEIRASNGRFVLLQQSHGAEALLGKTVRVELGKRGRPSLHPTDRGLQR